jgi:hypothetical protein
MASLAYYRWFVDEVIISMDYGVFAQLISVMRLKLPSTASEDPNLSDQESDVRPTN